MEDVTYSLRIGKPNSEAYYHDVELFTKQVLQRAENNVKSIVQDFMQYLNIYKLEELRKIEEYILELLSFGILWKTYAAQALSVHYAPFITMSRMAEWRKKHQRIKPAIDFVRGIFTTLFLLPGKIENEKPDVPTLRQIDHVCKWFEATGEFKEQALRFIRWRAFWGTKSSGELLKIFSAVNEFTSWFENNSETALGQYTENVEIFLIETKKHYRWREDRIQCGRTQLEYHLNMVGAELMNIAFREEFNKTESKVVLVPGCLRGRSDEECKANRVKEGLICEGCMPQCRVNQLREMGKKKNFEVYIIPHASDLSLWAPRADRLMRGVIASACVTTLVEGGWELKRYDVPAQCVLLDYSGCKKHWHCTGIPTTLNVRELKRILD